MKWIRTGDPGCVQPPLDCELLAWFPAFGAPRIIKWDADCEAWMFLNGVVVVYYFSHWMLLPNPPTFSFSEPKMKRSWSQFWKQVVALVSSAEKAEEKNAAVLVNELEKRMNTKMAELDDKIKAIQDAEAAFRAEVSGDVATLLANQQAQAQQITALQQQLAAGTAPTQAQLDQLAQVATDLTSATADLHAKVTPPAPATPPAA